MKNAEEIKMVAKQLIGVCNVIINLAEAPENELYDSMFWDELAHTQKLVLEFTKNAFEEEQKEDDPFAEDETSDEFDPFAENFDSAFFAGELNSNIGDKSEDGAVVTEEEEPEKDSDK